MGFLKKLTGGLEQWDAQVPPDAAAPPSPA